MSGFNTLLDFASANLGVTPDILIMIVFLIPAILFFAANFKVGIISSLVITAGMFIYFYEFGFMYDRVLIIMLMLVVVLAFTLYFINTSKQPTGFI